MKRGKLTNFTSAKANTLAELPQEIETIEEMTTETEVNPKRGHRSGFLKITITIPTTLLAKLRNLGLQRKAQGLKNTGVSELIREAAAELLKLNK